MHTSLTTGTPSRLSQQLNSFPSLYLYIRTKWIRLGNRQTIVQYKPEDKKEPNYGIVLLRKYLVRSGLPASRIRIRLNPDPKHGGLLSGFG